MGALGICTAKHELGSPGREMACERLPNEVAVVLGNWKCFGELPIVEWGRTTAMVSGTGNVGTARI
jgi:hypothetical protein